MEEQYTLIHHKFKVHYYHKAQPKKNIKIQENIIRRAKEMLIPNGKTSTGTCMHIGENNKAENKPHNC